MPTSTDASADPDFRISAGDVLAVRVLQQDALSTREHVRQDGKASLPLLHDVRSDGLSPGAELPSQRFVRTLGIDTMVELTHAFSRRLQLAVAAGIERGAGWHDAVAVLAIQASPPGRWF